MSKNYLLKIPQINKSTLQPSVTSLQFILNYSKVMDAKTIKNQRILICKN